MSIILDLAIILIAFGTIFIYYRKGFVKAVFGLGKLVLSVIISSLFGKGVGEIIDAKFMNTKVTESIFNSISKMYDAGTSVFDLSKLANKMPDSLTLLAEKSGVDINALTSQYAADTAANSDKLHDFSAEVAAPISASISQIIGYVLVFIGAYLLLMVAAFIIERVAELPIIRSLNRLLGLCLGIVCAVIFVLLFVFIANAIILYVVASGDQSTALDIVDKTFIFKFLSNIV